MSLQLLTAPGFGFGFPVTSVAQIGGSWSLQQPVPLLSPISDMLQTWQRGADTPALAFSRPEFSSSLSHTGLCGELGKNQPAGRATVGEEGESSLPGLPAQQFLNPWGGAGREAPSE